VGNLHNGCSHNGESGKTPALQIGVKRENCWWLAGRANASASPIYDVSLGVAIISRYSRWG
jgi:hypothetical protein